MAFMLIAVTLFFVLVGLFIVTIIFSNLKSSASIVKEENAMLLVSKIAESPEFSCGDAFSESRINCIDSDKAMALKGRIKSYSDFWGVSGIEIAKIYPSENSECTSQNYPDCGKIILIKALEGTGVSNFVALCRKEFSEAGLQDKCEIGKIIVTYNG